MAISASADRKPKSRETCATGLPAQSGRSKSSPPVSTYAWFAALIVMSAAPWPGSAQDAAPSGANWEALTALIPRAPDGKPKLDGVWQALAAANWDIRPHTAAPPPLPELGAWGATPPDLGIVAGGEIPYQPWARDKQKENYANRLTADPEIKCYMPGVPRATYLPHPFQIFQSDDQVVSAYQYANAVRTIHLNDPGPAPTSFWMGWSVGRWQGDTFVVDVTNQKAETWFDRAGNFHGKDLRVVERYTLLGPNHMRYEATIEDPAVYTRPWTISLPLYRRVEENAQLIEFKCIPFAEEILYGHLRAADSEDESEQQDAPETEQQ